MLSKAPLLCRIIPLPSASSAMRRQSRRRVPSVSMRPVRRAWPGMGSCRAPAGSESRMATTGAPSTRRTRTSGAGVMIVPLS